MIGDEVAVLGELQDVSFGLANLATRTSYPAERRMTGEQLVAYLDDRRYAVVATTRADGRPHAALSAYVRVGSLLWLPTVAGSARARNLARQPAVSLVISDGEGPDHAALIVEATALLVATSEVPTGVMEAYADRHGSAPDWASEWITTTPTRLLSYADARRVL